MLFELFVLTFESVVAVHLRSFVVGAGCEHIDLPTILPRGTWKIIGFRNAS